MRAQIYSDIIRVNSDSWPSQSAHPSSSLTDLNLWKTVKPFDCLPVHNYAPLCHLDTSVHMSCFLLDQQIILSHKSHIYPQPPDAAHRPPPSTLHLRAAPTAQLETPPTWQPVGKGDK